MQNKTFVALAVASVFGSSVASSYGALAYGLTDGNALVGFNTDDPQSSTSGIFLRTAANEAIQDLIGIDFRPSNNVLYGVGRFGAVYTISPTTGVATQVSTLTAAPIALDPTPDFTGLVGTRFGVDFNPVPDRLRVVSDQDQNLRINVDNGATITDGSFRNSGNPTITGAAYTNNDTNPATGTTLYYIDTVANALFTTADANSGVVTQVGNGFNFDVSNVNGFDISTVNGVNTAFAVLQREGSGVSELFTINLQTGLAASQGPIAGGELFDGLAIVPVAVPEPTTLAVLGGLGIVALRRRSRA